MRCSVSAGPTVLPGPTIQRRTTLLLRVTAWHGTIEADRRKGCGDAEKIRRTRRRTLIPATNQRRRRRGRCCGAALVLVTAWIEDDRSFCFRSSVGTAESQDPASTRTPQSKSDLKACYPPCSDRARNWLQSPIFSAGTEYSVGRENLARHRTVIGGEDEHFPGWEWSSHCPPRSHCKGREQRTYRHMGMIDEVDWLHMDRVSSPWRRGQFFRYRTCYREDWVRS